MRTGSFENCRMGDPSDIVPQLGMGATIILWTDRIAGTIVGIEPNRVLVQEDIAVRTDHHAGRSELQEYRYERNSQGKVHIFSRRRDGSWVQQGTRLRNGRRLCLGVRDSYRDPSF